MIRAVFFDVGNTLVDLDYALMATVAGGSATSASLEAAFGPAWVQIDQYLHDCYRSGTDPATLRFIISLTRAAFSATASVILGISFSFTPPSRPCVAGSLRG